MSTKSVRVGPETMGLNVVRADESETPQAEQANDEDVEVPPVVPVRPLRAGPRMGKLNQYLPARYEIEKIQDGKTFKQIIEDR